MSAWDNQGVSLNELDPVARGTAGGGGGFILRSGFGLSGLAEEEELEDADWEVGAFTGTGGSLAAQKLRRSRRAWGCFQAVHLKC